MSGIGISGSEDSGTGADAVSAGSPGAGETGMDVVAGGGVAAGGASRPGEVKLDQAGGGGVWLHRFALLLVLATLVLIVAGGNVTSKGVGLSVPDWPRSLGSYNPQGWTGIPGVRDEHAHRLIGAAVGLIVTILAVWVWAKDRRAWVRQLASVAWLAVVIQGVLGGLRVTEKSLSLAIIHGCLGQVFLCMTIALAAATSRRWPEGRAPEYGEGPARLRLWTLLLVLMAFLQLVLGAMLRQEGWGSVAALHITGALLYGVFFMQAAAPVFSRAAEDRLWSPMGWLLVLYVLQVILGLASYLALMNTAGRAGLTNFQKYVPTAHVAFGALVLGVSFYIALRSYALTGGIRRPSPGTTGAEAMA